MPTVAVLVPVLNLATASDGGIRTTPAVNVRQQNGIECVTRESNDCSPLSGSTSGTSNHFKISRQGESGECHHVTSTEYSSLEMRSWSLAVRRCRLTRPIDMWQEVAAAAALLCRTSYILTVTTTTSNSTCTLILYHIPYNY